MKKWLNALLCSVLMAAVLVIPAAATTPEEFQNMLETAGPGLLISPNPNAIPQKQGDFYVLVNGRYVTFPDAVPQLKNGRSCLPFVAVFEQLGFAEEDMTWNGETSTVTATKHNVSYSTPFTNWEVRQGDVTVTLTIGSTEFFVSYSGDTTADAHGNTVPVTYAFQTEAAPYLDLPTKRTYIPFGLVADALGYNVGWDAETGAVIIDDVDAILAANTASYEQVENYMDWYADFYSNNYKVNGNYGYDILVSNPDSGVDTTLSYNGTYNMITKGNSSSFEYEADMLMDMTFTDDGEDVTDLFLSLLGEDPTLLPMEMTLAMRGDTSTNTLYTNTLYASSAASLVTDPTIPEDAWVKTDLDTSQEASFAHLSDSLLYSTLGLEPDTADFNALLKALLSSHKLTDVDATCTDYLDYINCLYADHSLKRSGNTYTNQIERDGATFALTLYTNGSRCTGYGYAITETAEGMSTTMSVSMKNLELDWSLVYTPEGGTDPLFSMEMTGTYVPTYKEPQTLPPEGVLIIDQTAQTASAE